MKKLGLFILISILITYFVGVSCKLVNDKETEEERAAPGVTKSENGYSISFSKPEGMKYATIIRNSSDTIDMITYVTTKIGQIVIDDDSKIKANTFVYQDDCTSTEKYYTYRVQTVTKDGTFSSKTSEPVIGVGSGEAVLKTNVDESNGEKVFLTYLFDARSKERKMILSDLYTISLPDSFSEQENSQLRFAIDNPSNSKSMNLFLLAQAKIFDSGAVCDLKAEMNTEFFDKDLALKGLVGLYKESVKDSGYSTYHITNVTKTGLFILEYDEKGETVGNHDGTTEIKDGIFNVPAPDANEIIDLQGNRR